MRIEIDIFSPAGEIIGAGPVINALNFKSTETVNRLGFFSFDIPATDARITDLTAQRKIECYAYEEQASGSFARKLIGDGIIKNRIFSLQTDGVAIHTISGMGYGQELADDVINIALNGPDGGGVFNAPAQIIARFPGWQLDSEGHMTTETRFYGSFAGESGLEALIAVATELGENFVIMPGRKIRWLRSETAPSGIRAVKYDAPSRLFEDDQITAITSLEARAIGESIVTRVSPFGSGNGNVRLDLAAANWTPPTGWAMDKNNNEIINLTLEGEIGKIKRSLQFTNISAVSNTDADLQAAANQLAIATHAYMKNHAQEQKQYTVNIAGLRLGKIYPGQTIGIAYDMWDESNHFLSINEELIVLSIAKEFSGTGLFIPQLEVSNVATWIATDNQIIAKTIKQVVAAQAHPQLGPSCYYQHFNIRMDSGNTGRMRFELGTEIVTLNEACLYFEIDPLESSVKSVSGQSSTSGPSSKTTSDTDGGAAVTSGPSSKTTSDSGGGQTINTSGSSESVYIPQTAIIGETDYGAAIPNHKHAAKGLYFPQSWFTPPKVSLQFYMNAHNHGMDHTHSVQVPSHSHRMEHTHTFTAIINMVYGLFRNAGSKTLGINDLVIKVNGGADLRSQAVDLGSGRYKLDLTPELCNALFRPKRDSNIIVFSTGTAEKNCQITANLKIRSVIQAIAYI